MTAAPPPQPFAHLSAPKAELYGQVLGVFAQARERFIVHLRPEDVAGELRQGAGVAAGTVSLAARTLLGRLAARGTRLAYHGDFDWGGVRIAADVLNLPGAVPWRYDHCAYLATVRGGLGTPLTTGSPSPTPWDPPLRDAIERHGIRVEEELLLDEPLSDLQGDLRP